MVELLLHLCVSLRSAHLNKYNDYAAVLHVFYFFA